MQIIALIQRQPSVIQCLLEIWHDSVEDTHEFLSLQDIMDLRPLVLEELEKIEHLAVAVDDYGDLLGFLGVEGNKLEMLFLSPEARGQGLGKQMIDYALEQHEIRQVDVNEQNEQAVGFYRHLGFQLVGRSELDGQGNPFPLLHLALPDSTT